MEGHRRHLEAQPDDEQGHAGQQHPTVEQNVGTEELGHLGELGGTGRPVGQSRPVEKDGRRERAQDEVLEPGFARLRPAAVERGEHVEGDGHDLQAQEQHDRSGRLGHEHGPDAGEAHEGVGLHPVEPFSLQVAVRQQGPEHGGHADQQAEEHGEVVVEDLPADGHLRLVVGDVEPAQRRGHRRQAADDGSQEGVQGGPGAAGDQRGDGQEDERADAQDQHGGDAAVLHGDVEAGLGGAQRLDDVALQALSCLGVEGRLGREGLQGDDPHGLPPVVPVLGELPDGGGEAVATPLGAWPGPSTI